MFSWKPFVHPAKVYHLEYPAHWDHLENDEARSCGFGPHERDDVGLWISIMPISLDTDRMGDDLPELMRQAIKEPDAAELKKDTSLHHTAYKAPINKEGEGGNYWIVAGGDVVLFASTQVPVAERDEWNPLFDRVMASLHITRDDELLMRKIANEVMEELQKRHPEEEFEFEDKAIRGKQRKVFLSNLFREVRSAPKRRAEIVKHFVEQLSLSTQASMGYEEWEDVKGMILPVLKPKNYIDPNGPTKSLHTTEWLADVLICYVIKNKKFFRFVTGWDLNRWGVEVQAFHDLAIENLSKLPWPTRLEGARQPDGGRIILVDTRDSMSSSRLLHPELHRLFSGPLGNIFWVGIPDRDTLVAFSDRRTLKQRIGRRLRKDHDTSAYPITPRPFLVTRDGIAPAPK